MKSMKSLRRISLLMPLLLLVSPAAVAEPSSNSFVEWRVQPEVYDGLVDQFEQICGDAFCEGEFTNLTSMDVTCAVDSNKQVRACVWTFVGSDTDVDPTTGVMTTNTKTFSCDLDLSGPLTKVEAFLEEASVSSYYGDGLRYLENPNTGATLYDQLSECL